MQKIQDDETTTMEDGGQAVELANGWSGDQWRKEKNER